MRAALPIMASQRSGSVVNTSSTAAVQAAPFGCAYHAAKAGVVQLTKVAACEYGPLGVRVNAMLPGATLTGMADGMSVEALSAVAEAAPIRRLGQPRDIAQLALFLASDESSFITGAAIVIDGGMTVQFALTGGTEWWEEGGRQSSVRRPRSQYRPEEA
jgi:NAD(P)-dependent dehydrogenase (short-subunit alcohol dehydrogenase family)